WRPWGALPWPGSGGEAMRVLDGERVLTRVIFGERERFGGRPLELALLDRLRREGYAGATVLRGVAGFGARNVLRAAHLLELSAALPVLGETVDDGPRSAALRALLDEMVGEGLVTQEKARVIRWAPRQP